MTAEQLERLAAPRPLLTRELHGPNDYYGHASVLKRYAGLPARRSLKVAIEHGIAIIDQVWDIDVTTRMPLFLCATEARVQSYRDLVGPEPEAIAIGPMIAYVGDWAEPGLQGRSRRLVAFPAHSTHRIDAVYDVDGFARALIPYQRDWDEVVVCLYWRDILLGRHREYLEHGFRCTTAGHMYDPGFLVRLRGILAGADAVVSNEVGSHLLYAVALGKPVWLVDQAVSYEAPSAEILEEDGAAAEHWQSETILQLRRLFAEPESQLSAEQREFVHELIGMSQVRTREAMRELLLDGENRYRKGVNAPARAFAAMKARLRSLEERHAVGRVQ